MELGSLTSPSMAILYVAQGVGYRDPRDHNRDGMVTPAEVRAFDAARPDLVLSRLLRTAPGPESAPDANRRPGRREAVPGILPTQGYDGGLPKARGNAAVPGALLDLNA